MTDNDIKKALECCKTVNTSDCNNCPYYHEVDCTIYSSCCGTLMTDALSLINRLKQENEELKRDAKYSERFKKIVEKYTGGKP